MHVVVSNQSLGIFDLPEMDPGVRLGWSDLRGANAFIYQAILPSTGLPNQPIFLSILVIGPGTRH